MLSQEPGTTSSAAESEVAAWNSDRVLKCSGSPDGSGTSAFY